MNVNLHREFPGWTRTWYLRDSRVLVVYAREKRIGAVAFHKKRIPPLWQRW